MDSFRSSALTANLEKTQRTVDIPPEQAVLLDITSEYYGVKKRVRDFLIECNHPFANWEVVVNGLRAIALGDIHHYLNHDRSLEAMVVFFDLFRKLFSITLSPRVERELLRTFLEFLVKLLESQQAGTFQALILEMLAFLARIVEDKPALYARGSVLFHRASPKFQDAPQLAGAFNTLFRRSLVTTYQYWKGNCHIVPWYARNRRLFSPEADYGPLLADLDSDHWQGLIAKAKEAPSAKELATLPDFNDLVDTIIQAVEDIEEPADRAQFLLYLLNKELFTDHEHWLLSRLVACLRAIGQSDADVIEGFIFRFFSFLAEHQFERKAIAMNCAYVLGQELDRRGDEDLLSVFIERVVRLPFEPPDLRGVTSQWEVLVNPNHLPNVRLLLELVELNPVRFRRILSALILQLNIHGLFVADTDLFQKDITALLNADIRPVYQKVKQLARIFPVYFTEIGSEGELRDVSTEIDQIQERRDPLIHFLRKQTHVESNNTQVAFTRDIISFWTTGDKSPLEPWLPADVFAQVEAEGPYFDEVHQIFTDLDQKFTFPDYLSEVGGHSSPPNVGRNGISTRGSERLLSGNYANLAKQIDSQTQISIRERARAKLLLRLCHLLEQKYSFSLENIPERINKSAFVDKDLAKTLTETLAKDDPLETLPATLDVLENLKEVIFDPEITTGDERIYHKRHIAAGIPSMYGTYRERKFEALGLTLRLETLARNLYADLITSINLEYVTKKTLQDIHGILALLVRALGIDGMHSASLENNLNLLAMGLQAQDFSLDQVVNVFQYIAADVHEITNRYVLKAHTDNLEIILSRITEPETVESDAERSIYSRAEKYLRELITACFGLQDLDDLVGKVLTALTDMRQHLDDPMLMLLMSYDPYRLLSLLQGEDKRYDNPLHLGSKGYFLKQLGAYGLPVPEGFVVTTELFRCRTAVSYGPFLEDTRNRVKNYLGRLETVTGKRFGDDQNPLLLSVRSGSVMSMPGMMSTFLNVGLNDEIAECLGQREKYAWAGWDCYRRFIQSWAMAHDVPRDVFDETIQHFKKRYGVEKKMAFSPDHMREIAYYYKDIMADYGITLIENPFEQLMMAIQIVLESWFSERAANYRQHLGIAEQWGTAAIVQRMVFGNLNERSGSGVIMTRNPADGDTGLELYGDYNICSQGEDVVSGLVNPLPITESQQQSGNSMAEGLSLESNFPAIYQKLKQTAAFLIEDQDYAHQEIEFTFESERVQDLFILQTRNMVYAGQERVQVFVPSETLKDSLLGRGIGAGGGALSGRVAFTLGDIQTLQAEDPDCAVVLIRPDTVPEDFYFIAQADGLLTARGGITSHAAVAAQRLGKACVVNCRPLRVYESDRQAELNGKIICFGDHISIDGRQGTIYAGEFPVRHEDIMA